MSNSAHSEVATCIHPVDPNQSQALHQMSGQSQKPIETGIDHCLYSIKPVLTVKQVDGNHRMTVLIDMTGGHGKTPRHPTNVPNAG